MNIDQRNIIQHLITLVALVFVVWALWDTAGNDFNPEHAKFTVDAPK